MLEEGADGVVGGAVALLVASVFDTAAVEGRWDVAGVDKVVARELGEHEDNAPSLDWG